MSDVAPRESAMQPVVFVWANGDTAAFESRFGLSVIARRYRSLGFAGEIDLVFLGGLERLEDAYLAELERRGLRVRDAAARYAAVERDFPTLAQLPDPHRKWLLRWLVARDWYGARPILHLDADVVLNEDPAAVAALLDGRTFVLQGCPALAAIADAGWYEDYERELRAFAADREGYSASAWNERRGWEVTMRTRWAGSRFSEVIVHDQDLISHLIHAGRIRQDSVEAVSLALEDYLLFENPLFLDAYHDFASYSYARVDGIDYFDCSRQEDLEQVVVRRRPLLWHMQTSAARYVAVSLSLDGRVGGPLFGRIRLDATSERLRFASRRLRPIPRAEVYRRVFAEGDFAPVFEPRRWWKAGVFVDR